MALSDSFSGRMVVWYCRKEMSMANHFTPEELAKEMGMEAQGIIEFCLRESIPIYKGKIDRSLLAVVMRAKGIAVPEPQAVSA